ncbi:MAG: DUF2550 domain-containing protein [Actinomycetes bacterium]
MQEVVVPLAVVAALALLLVTTAAAFVVRRQTIARRAASFDCSLRRPDGHWSLGIARYGHDRIDWFRIFSFSLRPMTSWSRDELVVLARRGPEGSEATSVLPHSVVVRCRHRDDELDLAMSGEAYTGLASWLESSPPGRHAHVT